MTKKEFWKRASNWGMICGAALFAVSLISWGGRFEVNNMGWATELLGFAVIFAAIFYTGKQNATLCGPEGYSFSRAVGFVFAMMLFAGIVAGVGEFLMANVIARDYYDTLNARRMEAALKLYEGTPLEGQMVAMQDMMVRMLANPFVLIFSSIFNLVIKGGFLGLIVCAFLTKKPDIFAGAPDAQYNGNEQNNG